GSAAARVPGGSGRQNPSMSPFTKQLRLAPASMATLSGAIARRWKFSAPSVVLPKFTPPAPVKGTLFRPPPAGLWVVPVPSPARLLRLDGSRPSTPKSPPALLWGGVLL